MDPDFKEQLIGQFRQVLAAVETGDGALQAGPEEIDLHTLFTELVALKSEVKLESRQVKQALEHSKELIDGLRENNRQISSELTRQRREEKELWRKAERPLLLEILELRDRIESALRSVGEYRPGLLERPGSRKGRLIKGLGEGLEITLRRLDGVLAGYQISPVGPVGKRMDPDTMRVSGTEHRDDQDDGIVLTEVRKGYQRAGHVLRLAEVVVNKRGSKS